MKPPREADRSSRLAAGRFRGIDGALQFGYEFRNGTIQFVGDAAHRSPIVRLPRMNPNRLKQRGGGDVMGMGNKWHRHPFPDGLVRRVYLPHAPTGPGGESESARDCQHEGQPNSQYALPRFPHNSI